MIVKEFSLLIFSCLSKGGKNESQTEKATYFKKLEHISLWNKNYFYMFNMLSGSKLIFKSCLICSLTQSA